MLGKLHTLARDLGVLNAALYAISRLLERSGGLLHLYRYELVAQPVPREPLLGPRRGRSVEVRPVAAGDPALAALPLDANVLRFRYDQGALCLGAFRAGEMIGCLWLSLGPYHEDEVRCTFEPQPPGRASWDFDVYIRPDLRHGLAFARLWDAANAYLRARGVKWSFSRISAFNPHSLASHGRLGARRIGVVTFLVLGPWQLFMAARPPYLHVSAGPGSVPRIPLYAPPVPAESTAQEVKIKY